MVVVEGTPPALHGIGGGVSRCFECGFDDSKFEIFLIYCLPSPWTILTVHHHLRLFSVLSLHPLLPTFFLCPHSFSAHTLSLHTASPATHCCTSTAQTRSAGVYWTRFRYLKVCWHGPEVVAEVVAEVAVVVAIAACLPRSRRFICLG
jgi:hypothetical protein